MDEITRLRKILRRVRVLEQRLEDYQSLYPAYLEHMCADRAGKIIARIEYTIADLQSRIEFLVGERNDSTERNTA